MFVGDGQKIKFHDGTSINNCQMKLKINFIQCYVRVEQNNFLTFLDYYLKGLAC